MTLRLTGTAVAGGISTVLGDIRHSHRTHQMRNVTIWRIRTSVSEHVCPDSRNPELAWDLPGASIVWQEAL